MAKAIAYQSREPEAKVYPDRNWEYIFVGGSHEFLKNGARNLDARILFHLYGHLRYAGNGEQSGWSRVSVYGRLC